MSYQIGDKVVVKDRDGIYVVKAVVQTENGTVEYNVQNVGNDDDNVMVVSEELEAFDSSRGFSEIHVDGMRKSAMVRFVGILPDLRELAFYFNVVEESYALYILDHGHTVLEDDWEEYAKLVRSGRTTMDDAWTLFTSLARERDADYSGERIPELLKSLNVPLDKAAYTSFDFGDRVAFVVGNVLIKGKVVGGWNGQNQSLLVEDGMGIVHECQSSWLVMIDA